MEFASEMVVKATIHQLRITEVPTVLSPDGRSRPPHLRSWRDGWRHLRFLLLFSPRGLFLYPGLVMFLTGLLATLWLLPGARTITGVAFDIHTLLYAAVLLVVGVQSMLFWVFAKIYGVREGIVPPDPGFESFVARMHPELSLIIGVLLLGIGAAVGVLAVGSWQSDAFGGLDPRRMMRLVIPSATLILLGFQVAFAGLFASVLDIRGTAIPTPGSRPNKPITGGPG
jgi:hypothetical protein